MRRPWALTVSVNSMPIGPGEMTRAHIYDEIEIEFKSDKFLIKKGIFRLTPRSKVMRHQAPSCLVREPHFTLRALLSALFNELTYLHMYS